MATVCWNSVIQLVAGLRAWPVEDTRLTVSTLLESLSSKHFHEMSYLDARIGEILRLSPPVSSRSQKDAGPNPNPSKGRTSLDLSACHTTAKFPIDVAGIRLFCGRNGCPDPPLHDLPGSPELQLVSQDVMELPSSIPKADFNRAQLHRPYSIFLR